MNISSTTLSPVTATNAISATAPVGSAQSSELGGASGAAGTDHAQLSRMGELMSQLQNLESTNPDQAKQVLSNIASQLSDKASSTSDPHLQQLSDKFGQAAQTGDLSGLKPQGHGHHHHHAAASGGASSSDATAAASTVSGKTASYAQNASDPMAEVESVISNALASV
ncbi:MAG TPA: hypothetical protein VHW23_24980 [Kofleriaceae bacterium]|jgi:hypothetical protein|nr:hypothetical protein [Kofleriaceae bacterium]